MHGDCRQCSAGARRFATIHVRPPSQVPRARVRPTLSLLHSETFVCAGLCQRSHLLGRCSSRIRAAAEGHKVAILHVQAATVRRIGRASARARAGRRQTRIITKLTRQTTFSLFSSLLFIFPRPHPRLRRSFRLRATPPCQSQRQAQAQAAADSSGPAAAEGCA